MSNSPLVAYTKISPNKDVNKKYDVSRITPHCIVGQVTAESLGNWFAQTTTRASSNYGIDKNGRVGMYVEEKDRSWCSSSSDNDNRAITIECASDMTAPYAMTNIVYEKLIELCTDICKRYNKTKLLWIADKDRALSYKLAPDEMLITVHRWFAATECPGDWLYERLGDLAAKVTNRLNPVIEEEEGAVGMVKSNVTYCIKVGTYSDLNEVKDVAGKLQAAGFDPIITAKETIAFESVKNEEPKPEPVIKKTNAEIAKEIYYGKCSDDRWDSWGFGATRTERLKLAGYDPAEVQKEVNKLF